MTGFIWAIVILIQKLMNQDLQIGWPSLMVVILITGGFLFLMLGIIGSYIGKIIMTENHSPLYVVRDELQTVHKRENVRLNRQTARKADFRPKKQVERAHRASG